MARVGRLAKNTAFGKKMYLSENDLLIFWLLFHPPQLCGLFFRERRSQLNFLWPELYCLGSGVRFLLNNWRQDCCLILYVLLPKLLWMKIIPKPLPTVPSPEKYVASFRRRKMFSIVQLRKHLLLIHGVLDEWLVAGSLWRWIDLAATDQF